MYKANLLPKLKAPFLIVALLFFQGINAQNATNYVFSTTTGATLDPMTGATSIIGAGIDDGASAVTNIGFPFMYENTAYTQFSVSSNGLIRLGGTAVSTTFTNGIATNADNPKIMPMWDDICTGTGGWVKYVVTGTAPNRILKIEHYGRMDATETSASNSTFQTWFYEGTNVIEFVYGTGSNPVGATIGIAGATYTQYMARNHVTNQTAASTGGVDNIATWPGSGRKYTFTPPSATYRYYMYNLNAGTTTWCAGETRTVTIDIKNTGTSTWTNSAPDINVGVKWNTSGTDWTDYHLRTDAGSVAPGGTATYSFSVQAKNATAGPTWGANLATGTNNLTFDMVNEGNCWLGSNPGTCGSGTATMNMKFVSPAQTITTVPGVATTPSPATGATAQCYAGTGAITALTWTAVAGATSYDVYFGAGSLPGSVTTNVGTNSYTTPTLVANTTYYWKIVPKNACGGATGSSTWTFTTKSIPCYCTSTGGTSDGISGVTFNTLSNLGTGINTYTDYSATKNTQLSPSSTYNLTVNVNTGGNFTNYQTAWIDWNGNGSYTDAGETYNLGTATNVTNGISSSCPLAITVPAGATAGETRMRIQSKYSSATGNSCLTGFDGEVEDYGIIICTPPSSPTVTNNSGCKNTTVVLTASGAGAGENYKWYDAATAGTLLQTNGSTYTSPALSTTTDYWVSKYNTTTLCESGRVKVTATINACYVAQIQSVSTNATAAWCPGETKTITVTIKNAGTLPWTDGGGNDFNIGVKWNTNGANWADYYVRVDALNLAAGATTTYTFSLTASNATTAVPPGAYGAALNAGTNNLTFDVVKEGDCWFGSNASSCGIGNSVYTTSAITILAAPTAPTVTTTSPILCGQSTTLNASSGTVLVPSTGSNTVDCGNSILLQDHAGSSAYSNSVNGYTVLNNSGTGAITINGTYATEAGYDYIYVYNGVGTGGTQVTGSPFSGAGTINVTGTAGQALTVRFASDGSTTDVGFNLNVTYSNTSCGDYKWYNAATSGTLLASGKTYTVNPTTSTTYYCEFVNGVCNGTRSSTTISVTSLTAPTITGTTSVPCGQTTTITASQGTILVPSTGNNSSECGYNIVLQDHAGASNYSNSVDGYTVLKNSGTGTITINGSYATESGYDYIYIYQGSGTGGSQVAGSPFNGTGTINVTGSAGQALTVRFTSDGSTVNTGFNLNVTYSGTSCGTYKWYDASTAGTLLFTGAAYTTPTITSNISYYVEFNTGSCASSRTTSAITVTANPPATPTITGASSLCPGGTSTYTATSISGATYVWTLPSGWSGSSTSNSISVTAGSTAGTISVTATNTCGTSAAGTKVVTLYSLPTVNAGLDQAYCGRNILSGNSNMELVLLDETFETITAGTEITPNSTGSWKIKTLTGDNNWDGTNNTNTKWFISNSANGYSCAPNGNAIVLFDNRGSGGAGIKCDYFWGTTPTPGSEEMDQVIYSNSNINAQYYSNLKLRFTYSVSGDIRSNTAYDYMQVVYSTDGGTTWTSVNAGNAVATTYSDNNGTNNGYTGTGTGSTTVSGTTLVSLPSSLNGVSNLLVGFRWHNDNQIGFIPGITVDDVYLTGTPQTLSWSGPGIVSGGTTTIPIVNAAGTYTLSITSGNGCTTTDDVVITTPALTIDSISKTNPTLCGASGTLKINANPTNTSVCDWFSNTLSSASGLSLFGSATPVAEDGRLILTRAYGSQNGGIVIPNSSSYNAGSFKMEFDLYIGSGNEADGFSISYGGGIGTPTAGTENGHGTDLIIKFDTYDNVAGEKGIHLLYGGTAVTTRVAGTTWRNSKQHVYLFVNASNQLTLKVGNTTIFSSQALPSGYGSADKSAWTFVLSSRTGGLLDEHAIANLAIVAYNQFEYSINGSTWQTSNQFTPVAGTYTPQVRPKCSTSCGVSASSVTLSDPVIASNAFLATTSNSGVTLAVACEESGWTYYADPADLTKWLFGIYKNGNVFTPTVTLNVKSTGITAYDKVENTTAKKAVFTMGRYWNVVQGSMTGSNPMKVRFFYNPTDLSTMQTAANTWASSYPTTYTHAVEWFKTSGTQYNPGSNTYVDVPTSSAYSTSGGTLNGITYIEYQNVNSFSGGTAGIRVSPGAYGLPVKLLYLTATPIDNSFIRIDWATSLEIDNKGFDVERSIDGIHFDKIGWIDGNGNSTQTIKYKFDDKTVIANTVYYYRLKQIDYDGDEEYSNTVSASIKDGSGFTLNDLYPNPATEKVTISISTDFNQDVYVKVFDLLGQIILDKNWQVITGTNTFEIDLSSFASGTYTVSLFTGNQYLTKKLVVSK